MRGTPLDFFVQLHVTERCNLACRHCYQSGPVAEMSHQEVCRAITNVKTAVEGWARDYDMDISPSLHVTGGEPLLRDDLFPILSFARQCGFSASLMTNGTLVGAETARRIRMAGVGDVQVSLDGLESTHDRMRGRGAYRQALEGIRHLAGEGMPASINVTVSRLNMGQAGDLVAVAAHSGAGTLAFSRLVPSGRGRSLAPQALTSREVAAFHQDLKRHRGHARVTVTTRDPLASIPDVEGAIPDTEVPVAGCAAGMFGVTITADGTVMPCRRMDLGIGNIRTQSFRDLWADSPVLWKLRTRAEYHGRCGTCRFWPVCRGCRAVALAAARADGSEDFLGSDPQCPYFRLS